MEELFNKLIKYGKFVRKNRINGLNAWTDIKNIFTSEITCPNWNIVRIIGNTYTQNTKEIYDYVYNDLGMRGEDIDDDTSTPESHELWCVSNKV